MTMKIIMLLLLLLSSISAQADILCAKRRVKVRNDRFSLAGNLQLRDAATCPAGYSLIKNFAEIKDQQIAAFARIAGDGSVLSFGGANITGVSVTQPFAGRFDITFTGSFELQTEGDSEQNRNLFTVNSSAVADNYGSTNNGITFASSSEIAVTVFLWKSDTLHDESQAGINVSLLQGE